MQISRRQRVLWLTILDWLVGVAGVRCNKGLGAHELRSTWAAGVRRANRSGFGSHDRGNEQRGRYCERDGYRRCRCVVGNAEAVGHEVPERSAEDRSEQDPDCPRRLGLASILVEDFGGA